MLRSFALVVALVGCATDPADPTDPTDPTDPAERGSVTIDRIEGARPMVATADEPDVCELAATLPSDDICSLACDPTAMAERMLADGSDAGACYQLYCSLPGEKYVLVGVCLPR
jgi:hypothetical protein